MKATKAVPILFLLFFLPVFAILIRKAWLEHAQEGLSDIGQAQDFPYSRYSIGNGKIYFIKAGSGYFPVEQADPLSFKALNQVNTRGTMGKDNRHVFFKTRLIPGVSPVAIVYLGNNFFKAGNRAYYGDTLLRVTNIASFRFIKGYYAADRQHIFYKQQLIPCADARPLKSVMLPDDYISDSRHVYYKGDVIPGARPEKFASLAVNDDQWGTQYAFDGTDYFFEKYPIRADDDQPKKNLSLLSLDKGFGWSGLFYRGDAIYCYDTGRHSLKFMGTRDNSAPFHMINRGIYTDGKHIYFTYGKWNRSGGRTPRYTGHTTGLCIVAEAACNDFRSFGSYTTKYQLPGVLYRSGTHTFFHPAYEETGSYSAALMLLNADGTTEKLSTGNGFSKYISTTDGPSFFSLQFYKNLFKASPVYDDY